MTATNTLTVLGNGPIAIASRQDTSTFASKDKSAGVNVSVTFAGQVSASGNLSTGKQSGDFASVETQAGIRAGDGGFGIRVAGATDLKGAVIASTADAARNQLTTGTLTASALENRETFKATSLGLGAGLGANLGKDRTGTINTDQSGNKLPGIKTGIGTLSATPPTALSASGSQASTTVSAIAQGGITVTSGDTASLGVTQTISRDTSAANDALTKQFTEAKRNEIAQGFEATRQLVSEVGTFFANRGRDEAAKRKLVEANEAAAIASGVAVGADGRPIRNDKGSLIPLTPAATAAVTAANSALRDANQINSNFGGGSPARLIASALTGAAGSNVAGGLGDLVQGAAVNVLQSLAATEVKRLVDGLGARDAQGNLRRDERGQIIPTTESEALRTALQAVVGCAGSAAGGNSCGAGATGAAVSVIVNNLITAIDRPRELVAGERLTAFTLEEQQARANLVGTLVAGIASAAGLSANTALNAAVIETENNENVRGAGFITSSGEIVEVNATFVPGSTGLPFDEYIRTPAGQNFLRLFVGTPEEQRDRAGQYSRTTPEETAVFGGQPGLFAFLNTPGTSIDLFRSDPALRAQFDRALGTSQSVRVASAAFGGAALLGTLRTSDPQEYARVVEQFGGNPESAAIAYGLFERFRGDKLTFNLEIQRTINGLPEFDSLTTAVRAGVPRAANSIGNFVSDPIGSIQRGVSGLVDFVTNPGAAAQAISDREFITNVLLTAATLTGDDALRRRVATDVGGAAVAFVIEARVGEAAVGGAARVARPVVAASVDTLSSALQSLAAQRAVRTILSEAIPSPSPLAGARVTGQASAESANAAFSGGNSIYDPPYTLGTVVREFTTTQPTTLVRVTVDPASTTGRFFVQASEIAGKTPEEIRIYLGLELTPAYIQRVTIPIGTVLREGKVGPQLRFPQPTVSPGAIQFQASGSSRIAETNFGNLVPIRPGVPVR